MESVRQVYLGLMELEEEEALLAAAVIATSTTKRRHRRHWVQPINQRRSQYGAYTATLWLSYWRMVTTLVTLQAWHGFGFAAMLHGVCTEVCAGNACGGGNPLVCVREMQFDGQNGYMEPFSFTDTDMRTSINQSIKLL